MTEQFFLAFFYRLLSFFISLEELLQNLFIEKVFRKKTMQLSPRKSFWPTQKNNIYHLDKRKFRLIKFYDNDDVRSVGDGVLSHIWIKKSTYCINECLSLGNYLKLLLSSIKTRNYILTWWGERERKTNTKQTEIKKFFKHIIWVMIVKEAMIDDSRNERESWSCSSFFDKVIA